MDPTQAPTRIGFEMPPPLTPGSAEAEQRFLESHQYHAPSRMPRFYESTVPLLTTWDPPSVRMALDSHVLGQFSTSALLLDEMLSYEALDTARSTRVLGVTSRELIIEPNPRAKSHRQASLARDMLKERIDDVMPEYSIDKWITYGEGLGFQASQVIWSMDERRWWPTIQHWHGALVYYLTASRSFMAITMDGAVPVVPGDGHWILHAPHGLYRGWLHSKVRACAYPWLASQYALRDWMRYCEVHGLPIKKLKIPAYAYEKQKVDFERMMSSLGSETVIPLPQNVDPTSGAGWDVELLEATGNSWQGFQAIIDRCDRRCAISWLGQNLTTEIDAGSLAAASVHDHVKLDITRSDARHLANTINTQLIVPWARYNFDDESLAPIVRWRVEAADDLQAKSAAVSSAATAYQVMVSSGIEIDAKAFFKGFGVTVTKVGPPPGMTEGGGTAGAPPTGGGPQQQPPSPQRPPSQPVTMDEATDDESIESDTVEDAMDLETMADTEGQSGVDNGDAFVDSTTADGARELGEAMAPTIDAVLAAVRKAKSPSEVKARMPDLTSMDLESIASVIQKGLVLGHLSGRASIHEDHDPEENSP